jgi:ABC-type sulfate/molybdate transport systems ATPase subunit
MTLRFTPDSRILLPNSRAALQLEGGIAAGEIVALQGPSGIGKTTLLKHIAQVGDAPMDVMLSERAIAATAPEDRGVSLVFQKALLLPHLSVRENLRFPLRFQNPFRSWSRELQDARVDTFLEELSLMPLAERSPSSLSGGEAMRVALLRAVISTPKCLLLDEAFSALDKETKARVKSWLRTLIKENKIATLLVTHLSEDLENFADRNVPWPAASSPLRF